MDNEQTPAQSEQQAQEPAQPQQPSDGVQRRIDQLTAKTYELMQQNTELQNKLLEMAVRPQVQPAAPTPEVDPLAPYNGQLDETVGKAVRAATEALAKRFESQLGAQQQQFKFELNALRVPEVASSTGVEVPKEVVAKAMAIAKQYGTSPDVALQVAYGEFALSQAQRAKPVAGYQPPPTPVLTGGAPAPQPARGAPAARPANFDQLDYNQQLAYYEKHGFDDPPIG